ncbi:MAG: hypothetical protein ABIV21_00865 [Pyrinomonadaceae bacterium]
MRISLRIFLVLAMLIAAANAAFGQTRIKFKRGATSAIVTGRLKNYKSTRSFVVRVRKGQTLTTSNVGKSFITVYVEAPPGSTYEDDLAADCHDKHEVTPTVAGDYTINVNECLKADPWRGSFKVKVEVR